MNVRALTVEEKRAIRALKRVARRWPKTLWLYVGSSVNVMLTGPDGKQIFKPGGGVDPEYLVEDIDIPADSGDW